MRRADNSRTVSVAGGARSSTTRCRCAGASANCIRCRTTAESKHQTDEMSTFIATVVLGADFGKREIGTEVRIDEEAGDAGPQASTVRVLSRHHIVP